MIRKDCTRTFSHVLFFKSAVIQDMIVRLLLVFTLEHPDIGYKQGLTDLVAILLLCVYCERDKDSTPPPSDGGFALQQHTLDVLDAHLRFQPQLHDQQSRAFEAVATPEQHAMIAGLRELTATEFIEHDCYLLLLALFRPLVGCYSAQYEASPDGIEHRIERVVALVTEWKPAVAETFSVAIERPCEP